MKSKIKVSYVYAANLEELTDLTNKEIEAIQVNVRNTIKDIQTISKTGGDYIVQITYEETKEILNESVDINVEE